MKKMFKNNKNVVLQKSFIFDNIICNPINFIVLAGLFILIPWIIYGFYPELQLALAKVIATGVLSCLIIYILLSINKFFILSYPNIYWAKEVERKWIIKKNIWKHSKFSYVAIVMPKDISKNKNYYEVKIDNLQVILFQVNFDFVKLPVQLIIKIGSIDFDKLFQTLNSSEIDELDIKEKIEEYIISLLEKQISLLYKNGTTVSEICQEIQSAIEGNSYEDFWQKHINWVKLDDWEFGQIVDIEVQYKPLVCTSNCLSELGISQ